MVSNIDFGPRADAEDRKHQAGLQQEQEAGKAHAAQMKAKAAEDAAAAANALPPSPTAQDLVVGLESAQPGSPVTVAPSYADQHPERFQRVGQPVVKPGDLLPHGVKRVAGPQEAPASPTGGKPSAEQGKIVRSAGPQKG